MLPAVCSMVAQDMKKQGVKDRAGTARCFMLAAVFGVADVFRARADSFGSGGLKQNPNLRKYLF